MKKYMLEAAVFFCGAIVMIYELAGSRIVAPYFGTSIYVWTSLIGVILASLALGYWLGGRMADKKPEISMLSGIILLGAVMILVTTLFKNQALELLSGWFKGMMQRTLFSALLLFAPASIFLGMVSPYAVRLKMIRIQHSGKTVGNLYAISTIGSIFGTFAAGFLLIPWMGTENILFMISAALCLISAGLFFSWQKGRRSAFTTLFLLLFIAGLSWIYNTAEWKIISVDTQYNRVRIFETEYWITGEPVKLMMVNNEYSSAAYPDSDELVYEYLQYFRLAEHFHPGFENTLMIGGAAYSYPVWYLNRYSEACIDVVEIDPGLTKLAREHFRLEDNDRMRIFHEDARTYLNNSTEKYDLILGDAYKSLQAIPFQLTSLEAAQKKYALLTDKGVLIENVIASLQGPASAFLMAEVLTLQQVFPRVMLFACHDPEDKSLLQSIVLVALKSGAPPDLSNDDPTLQAYLQTAVEPEIRPGTRILTDDYAPVEYFAMKSF